ncbi:MULTISPECIES: ParA family protein [Pseudomonas]|uniref:ParA family protein n=2 Tax=Pseudomonas nitroreducens TaxID=46680 RepID=A0A6G6J730_PSENT|nr:MULTISPECIES: ParA family protein [Pseudomonas]MBD9634559.1 ParA family protein [Pseudomonas sp. PDM19]QIE91226.1 ParA family protein [Pseudomonas nitroreducens]
MNTHVEHEEEMQNYVDWEQVYYTPQFAADCFGLTTRRLKDIEEENGIDIPRVPRGTVTTRAYRPSDLFKIAAVRRQRGYTKPLQKQVVISVFIHKGGTAKSTNATNLAIQLQLSGQRVLVIDNDPQGDTSSMFDYDADLSYEDLEAFGIPKDRIVDGHLGNLIAPLLRMKPFETKTLEQVVKMPFGADGPHIIPADNSLEDLSIALDAANNPDFWYSEWIKAGNSGKLPNCDLSVYDVIIFDNAPAASRLTKNSVAACDLQLCPIRMDKLSFRALNRLNDWLLRFAEDYKRSPALAVIPTMFIRNRPRILQHLALLNEYFPGRVTQENLYFSEDYSKAMDQGFPLLLWRNAKSDTLEAARKVYQEILQVVQKIGQAS